MRFHFKNQSFQSDAAAAVCDLFIGQPLQSENFSLNRLDELSVGSNDKISVSDETILKNLRGIQARNNLPLSESLDGKNFSIEMETGVGKTYTYIKTMYELHRRYGWRKFIVVVPSVAIREGVKKSFAVTEEHFAAEYGEKIRHFVYNSKNLSVIKNFVSDSKIWAMIINVQAFNSSSNDARRILREQDEFQSQIPIEVIAKVNPIVIIDEPQSVEGENARKKIKDFKPLMTLRYSATHKNLFNLVYRLDALDAYQKRLVKKISVKGIDVRGGSLSGYIFFEAINLSKQNPTATLTFNKKTSSGIKRITRKISERDNLFAMSGELEDYRNFVVDVIDGANKSVEFLNGLKIFVGQVVGDVDEEELRRIQIRETIQSHLEREAQLFGRGIKVLSLFFIDEVAKYRQYEGNIPTAGIYAKIFEEEYIAAVQNFRADADYKNYLESIAAQDTHAGYFSVDKKNHIINSKIDDVDAYDLIMRNKERLLDFKTPVRFIFSHSALSEGWDNPNVFQICTLKQSSSDIRRRQEVGRGMRLCVNQNGERMDEDRLGEEIHKINILTVIASESYQSFAEGLQKEIADVINRPAVIDGRFFIGKKFAGVVADKRLSRKIYNALIRRDYLDDDGKLTEKFYTGEVDLGDELRNICADVTKLLGGGYEIENARDMNVEAVADADKLHDKKFLELWARISQRSFYSVEFDSANLISHAADALNKNLTTPKSLALIESGSLNDELIFDREHSRIEEFQAKEPTVETDLIAELANNTDLTRRDIAEILKRIELRNANHEKFIPNAAKIIKSVKAAQFADNISYTALDEHFSITIFNAPQKGRLNISATPTAKNIYDYLIYDSDVEKKFAADMETYDDVLIYAKLPNSFYIPTPFGNYNPDWAIVFREGSVKNIYFVVETKGTTDESQLRGSELGKINCAKKCFEIIGGDKVRYMTTDSFQKLLEMIK